MTGTFMVLAAWNGLSASMKSSRLAVERPVRDSDLGAARRDDAAQPASSGCCVVGFWARMVKGGEHEQQDRQPKNQGAFTAGLAHDVCQSGPTFPDPATRAC